MTARAAKLVLDQALKQYGEISCIVSLSGQPPKQYLTIWLANSSDREKVLRLIIQNVPMNIMFLIKSQKTGKVETVIGALKLLKYELNEVLALDAEITEAEGKIKVRVWNSFEKELAEELVQENISPAVAVEVFMLAKIRKRG